jgi:septal ring-binding cell division protein DamX/type II secretory pathway predicted ATPase ExeA
VQRTFLELTHNPFAPPREGFFGGADRKTHLDQIRHLSQWSRGVLLVTGPFGIGKSILFKELSSSLPASAKGARVSGSLVTGEREVLLAIMQGLGIGIDQDMHIEDIVALLTKHVDESAERGRMCVVMFDDAHLLTHTAVALLMRLVAGSSLRIVMFAEPALLRNINRSAKKHEVEWFEIRLSDFPEQDVRAYLEWRFAQAQYRGRLPFTDQQVKKIAERSHGNPNVVDHMANELLADLETGEVRDRGGRFPRRHALLVVVLGVLVFLVYELYQQPATSEWVDDAGIAAGDRPETAQINMPPSAAEQSTVEDAERPDSIKEISAERALDLGEGAEPPSLEDPVNARLLSRPVLEPIDQKGASEVDLVDGPSAPTRVEKPDTGLVESIAPLGREAVNVPPTTPIPVVEASFEGAPPAARLQIPNAINGPDWLQGQNPEHYTLQLMTLSRTQGGVDLILRQDNRDEFAMYPLSRNGNTMYVLTFGVFPNEAAAKSAAENLKGELANVKPWIRQLSAVQEGIND